MSRRVPPALALGFPLAYGVGLWLVWLHTAEGGHEHNEPPLLVHWLRDSTLALPGVVAAAWAALWLARRLWQTGRISRSLETAVTAAFVAVAVSAALALGTPVHERLFAAHEGNELPLFVHILRDAVVALAVALPATAVLAAVRAGLVSPRVRPVRPRLALAGFGVAVFAAATGGAVQASGTGPGNPCASNAPVKRFTIVAIDIKIPLNRFGDHDRNGKMYVLEEDLAAARAQEQRLLDFLSDHNKPRNFATPGLRGDAVQPLVIRANEGDCVEVTFKNRASGTFGIHIDGLIFEAGSSGDAVGANTRSAISSGENTTYVWSIPNDRRLEGAHYLSPGPGNRTVVSHGLFGTLVVEPRGSIYLDPIDRDRDPTTYKHLASGEEAIVVPPADYGPAFRDNVTIFHEIGNENDPVFNADGNNITRVDPTTEAYRPATRAVNYRSETFMNRLEPDHHLKSLAYDSYTFGDPATPITRAYVGDPMKIRLLHGGSEMFHVYHLHGGGLRWPFQSTITKAYDDVGLDKFPPRYSGLRQADHRGTSPSNLLDSQAFGPGESYNFELSGGAGGKQQAVGDFTYHCHVAEHYISGMWGVRRTFDTLRPDLQPLPSSTLEERGSVLVDLHPELGRTPPAPVNSAELMARHRTDPLPDGSVLDTTQKLDDWIRPQLPPQGLSKDPQDAAVWNWTLDRSDPDAPVYLGEPEESGTERTKWPDLVAEEAGHPGSFLGDRFKGDRPEILFNPDNGRPTYPLLRTHVFKRPPFSPNGHSGAPYLGEDGEDPVGPKPVDAPVEPWAGRNDGICPKDFPVRTFNVVSIEQPIEVTRNPSRIDEHGKILVLAKDKSSVTPQKAQPLAIRGNVHDCLDVTLTSEQRDADAFGGFAKANLHVHHVQFDPLGSDGAVVGFNYEMSIRPYKVDNGTPGNASDDLPHPETDTTRLDQVIDATTLLLADATRFRHVDSEGREISPGVWVAIGLGTESFEPAQIESIASDGRTVKLTKPLTGTHEAGEFVGVEFARSRWWLDIELDNIFFHDHVDGIHGWPHGAVGMIIVEPEGATYHDPQTGAPVDSGTVVDIRCVDDCSSVAPGLAPGLVQGSFREAALWMIDGNPVTDSTFNVKAAPFSDRGGDPSQRLTSGGGRGDPPTPLLQAYPGDPVVFRLLNVSPNIDTFRVAGQRFFVENRCMNALADAHDCAREDDLQGSNVSSRIDTVHIGPSERLTLILDGGGLDRGAGGPLNQPGDYLYMNGVDRRFRQGAWGIVRVLSDEGDVQRLPDHPVSAEERTLCPDSATAPPTFRISAIDLPSSGSGGGDGRKAAYVPTDDVAAVKSGAKKLEPLVLHVVAGTCIKVHFKNERAGARASFHVSELLHASNSTGLNVGTSSGSTLPPNGEDDYVFFADTDKIVSALIGDFGGDDSGKDGLYGAVVVAPNRAQIVDSATGVRNPVGAVGTQVTVDCTARLSRTCAVDGRPVASYRDFTLAFSDDDPQLGADFMPYPTEARDPALVNYRAAPRRDDTGTAFAGTPGTPLLQARAGEAVVVHAFGAPGSEQTHVFTLGGMSWPLDPQIDVSPLVSNFAFAPWMTIDAAIARVGPHPMDYFYGDRRRPFAQAGMWGIFRVSPP